MEVPLNPVQQEAEVNGSIIPRGHLFKNTKDAFLSNCKLSFSALNGSSLQEHAHCKLEFAKCKRITTALYFSARSVIVDLIENERLS